MLGPPPPLSQPAGTGDPVHSGPTEPAPGSSGVPTSPPDQPAADTAADPAEVEVPPAAPDQPAAAWPAEAPPAPPAPLPADTGDPSPLPASPGSPGSPDDKGPRGPRVCQSAPIFQGRSAVIAREYAKDRAVYVHQPPPRSGASLGAVEEEAEGPGGDAEGGSLPVQARRGRGHVYATPQRPTREGAAAVVRGGELAHPEGDVAAQQRAAVAAAEEDARVRARQRAGAWHTE